MAQLLRMDISPWPQCALLHSALYGILHGMSVKHLLSSEHFLLCRTNTPSDQLKPKKKKKKAKEDMIAVGQDLKRKKKDKLKNKGAKVITQTE